jgi:RimJ/RimL family protein N-acetyltransferase
MIELRGERVVLRALEREHCRELWQHHEPVSPVPTEPLNVGLSLERADQWFEEMQAKQGQEHVYLGIFDLESQLLGDIQLANIDWRNRTASLGGGLSLEIHRGRGYGTDAARTILRYGFQELGLYRVEAETADYNVAARRVMEKLGFREEGCMRQKLYRSGKRRDSLVYGLLWNEFAIDLTSDSAADQEAHSSPG